MDDFKSFERAAWERKAQRYDDTWGSVTKQAIGAVLDAVKIVPGTSLLDCGCGLGHLCFEASKRGALVTGTDYSREMLRLASDKYPELKFHCEDAEALSFKNSTFDAVTLNYLLLHVSDQRLALSEASRVLKSGGMLAFSMWLPPKDSPGLQLIFSALRRHADMNVIPPAEDIFMFASAERAGEFLSTIGFRNIETKRFETVWRISSGESFFKAVQAGTRMGGLIELQAPEVREKIRESILSGIEEFRSNDKEYVISTPSLIVSAIKK